MTRPRRSTMRPPEGFPTRRPRSRSTPTWKSCCCSTRSTKSTRRDGRSLETMPSGYVGALAESDARAFADALAAQTAEARNAATFVEHRACVAGVPIALEVTDADIGKVAVDALANGGDERFPPVTITVWDSESTGVPPPPPMWDWHATRYQSDDVIVTYERDRRRLTLVDLTERTACYWMASTATWPVWERAAPFRDVLDRLLAPNGHVFLHGGTLGDDDVAVVLAGPSGSGKSTTTAAGVAAGLTTLGDDYVVLDPDGVGVHALYTLYRLEPSSPAASGAAAVTLDHQGKLMVPFAGLDGGSPLRHCLRLTAVVAPFVGTSPSSFVREI